MKEFRVLICGDRHWTDYLAIKDLMIKLCQVYKSSLVIIEGEAHGADIMAAQAAEELGVPDSRILRFPVTKQDWNSLGKSAGHLRNRKMLIEGKPNLVFAFHDSLEFSKGTANMVNQSRKAGVPVKLIHHSLDGSGEIKLAQIT